MAFDDLEFKESNRMNSGTGCILSTKVVLWLPAAAAFLGLLALGLWLFTGPRIELAPRVPGTDHAGGMESAAAVSNPVLAGKLILGNASAADLPGFWPGFRGANRDGLDVQPVSLARSWSSSGPRELWAIDVGEGYAGAAVSNGRVYIMDYDRDNQQDALRCLSLADGQEIWRYAYPVSVKRNHGMSRTVPVVAGNLVIALGPKCHLVCLDATTGELRWGLDLVREFGTTIPPWYAGQCPLVDNGALILAPGGPEALMVALNPESGEVLWRTPNPHGWRMTHASITPMELANHRMYIYPASKGVVGVSAKDGSILWETTDWKISIATVPSPVVLDGGRIFLSGGYNAGSLMLQLEEDNGKFSVRTAFRLEPGIFGATQQTPIHHNGHLYGIRPDGQFVCLNLDGKLLWSSGHGQQFGLGPFLIANGLIFAMNDSGTLTLMEASSEKFNLLGQARVLNGRESWGPLTLAGTRLIARDLTRMVCLEVGQ
jgi:outer membrane protein assembly factor BamB